MYQMYTIDAFFGVYYADIVRHYTDTLELFRDPYDRCGDHDLCAVEICGCRDLDLVDVDLCDGIYRFRR